jgi:hypothetical protein
MTQPTARKPGGIRRLVQTAGTRPKRLERPDSAPQATVAGGSPHGFPARPAVVLLRLIVLTSALVATVPGQGAVSNRTVGPDSIGAYGVREPYRAAARAFGSPMSRVSTVAKGCYVTWGRIGIRARYAGTCRSPLFLITASVTARGWETRRGLRIGDPVARVKALYPDSRGQHLATGGLRFNISGPVFSVIVKRGRVARLDVAVARTASIP